MVGPEVTVTPPVQHPWVNDKVSLSSDLSMSSIFLLSFYSLCFGFCQMIVDGSPLLKNVSSWLFLLSMLHVDFSDFLCTDRGLSFMVLYRE